MAHAHRLSQQQASKLANLTLLKFSGVLALEFAMDSWL